MLNKAKITGKNQTFLIIGPKSEAAFVASKISNYFNGQVETIIYNWADGTGSFEKLVNNHDIICLTPGVKKDKMQVIMSLCQEANKTLYLVPGLFEVLLQGASFFYVGDIPLLRVSGLGLSYRQQWKKRILDLLLSAIGLVLAFFLFPLIALAIKLTSPGPVFYTQERVGLNGKIFKLFKFRSMIHQAEQLTGPVLATKDDSRVTPVGKILRASRLDELPQLYNVLRGDMSIVGPRPERPIFVKEFMQTIPHYRYRLHIRPGITGLAQVKGRYATSAEDKLIYDLWYINNYSLWLDLRIVLLTARVVLTGSNARGITPKKPLVKP
jgi:exopolysaccharide biosynthesis polyprenyl glycosylphosphotransferase